MTNTYRRAIRYSTNITLLLILIIASLGIEGEITTGYSILVFSSIVVNSIVTDFFRAKVEEPEDNELSKGGWDQANYLRTPDGPELHLVLTGKDTHAVATHIQHRAREGYRW